MRAKVMVVGVYHLGETNDMISVEKKVVGDFAEQVDELVEALAAFHPTKLAVEVLTELQGEVNEKFRNYRHGNAISPRDEVEIIGFPLAKRSGIEEISCIDWMGSETNYPSFDEALQYASEQQPEWYESITENYIKPMQNDARILSELKLLEAFQRINHPQSVKWNHQFYMDYAMIGKMDEFVAADWLSWWYKRNLIIYSNVRKLISTSEERILLLIGGGHVHLVKQFLSESNQCEVVEAIDYLK
ncbi:MAG TPA: DUF5694 domain-containing protein [Sporosarcina psychrophila]|uniref:DUF5694 domain-containing protein n=1 Tax=Sporosarcina psychrophila TaxID=1476 RepID=A0A921G457_SPOPS|nr:DUF5694 domain-containing protein [Sporosarcina psychrophila]